MPENAAQELDSILDDYLSFIKSLSSVTSADGDTICLVLPLWSLPATREFALAGRSDYRPWLRLYVTCTDIGWQVSDRGETLRVVNEIGVAYNTGKADFQKDLSTDRIDLGPNGTFSITSHSGYALSEAIHKLASFISTLDGVFGNAVWQTLGRS